METVVQNAMAVRQFVGLTSEKYLSDWIYVIYAFAIFFANVFIRLKLFLDTNESFKNFILKDQHLPVNNNSVRLKVAYQKYIVQPLQIG